jgi:hypothetical protein
MEMPAVVQLYWQFTRYPYNGAQLSALNQKVTGMRNAWTEISYKKNTDVKKMPFWKCGVTNPDLYWIRILFIPGSGIRVQKSLHFA